MFLKWEKFKVVVFFQILAHYVVLLLLFVDQINSGKKIRYEGDHKHKSRQKTGVMVALY